MKSIVVQARDEATDSGDETQKRKIRIFSFFADTVQYIRENSDDAVRNDPDLAVYSQRIVAITGGDEGVETSRQQAIHGFAPTSSKAPPGDS